MEIQDGGLVLFTAIAFSVFSLEVEADSCGPIGYKAAELLGYEKSQMCCHCINLEELSMLVLVWVEVECLSPIVMVKGSGIDVCKRTTC